ncbi:MAG TPA: hypothetical protein P5136_02260, partial [Methanofastidiosum sp.]|nr:hypothetical protein [Methanofastidiosum sp.]
SSPLTVNYTNNSIKTIKQPIISIISVLKNNVVLSTDYYSLSTDTGILKNSTRSSDKIVLTSAGITSSGYFVPGDSVEINYLYNGLLSTIENDLNSTTNHYENRDYLLRGMTEVTINLTFRFKEISGQNFDDVSTQVALDESTYINSILNQGSLERADIVSVAKANAYVDNIDLSSVVITPVGGGTVTAQGDVEFAKNEYPASGTITLTRWTS